MSKTVKLTARVNAKSPKYGYGFHSINNGWRVDVPYHSIAVFGKSSVKPTIRSKRCIIISFTNICPSR